MNDAAMWESDLSVVSKAMMDGNDQVQILALLSQISSMIGSSFESFERRNQIGMVFVRRRSEMQNAFQKRSVSDHALDGEAQIGAEVFGVVQFFLTLFEPRNEQFVPFCDFFIRF